MTKPQQPELRRSGLGSTDQEGAEARARDAEQDAPAGETRSGPVPPDNQPGHRPEHEQDKPDLAAFRERLEGEG
jgi:hypothetical protein